MDPAALGELGLSSRCALADRPDQAAGEGLRAGALLPIPHGPGLSHACVGQSDPERHRLMAIRDGPVWDALGVRVDEANDSTARAAEGEHLMRVRLRPHERVLVACLIDSGEELRQCLSEPTLDWN